VLPRGFKITSDSISRGARQIERSSVVSESSASATAHSNSVWRPSFHAALAGVDADAHPDGLDLLPPVASQRALRVDRRMHGVLRAAERDEQRITLNANFKARVMRKGRPQHRAMRLQRSFVAIDAQRTQQPCRTLDVAHQEGDGAGGTHGGEW
jgi:hypothetical protein